MKNFYNKHRIGILISVYTIISLLPTLYTLFYKGRQFIDLGLLLTSILVIILVVPVYNLIGEYSLKKKEKKD